MTKFARLPILVCVLLAAAPATASAYPDAGPPTDYTKTKNLNPPRFQTQRTVVKLPAFDGRQLHLEVVKPTDTTRRYPVILESSPYHGTLYARTGTRILPEPRDAEGNSLGLTGYFAPRGYAVVMMDLRGTGLSQGCLDHLGLKDARDIKQVVEWAASQPWSNGRVGMTGHSYVGSTPAVAAAQRPKGLATIVPSAGLASMYDHQFQGGVPYFAQWAGPIEGYEQLALERKLPIGEDFGNSMEETGCGVPNAAIVAGEDQLSGRYSDWHVQRDWAEGATRADIPIFLVHGVNDEAARVAAMEWFTRRNRAGDKLWLGQWNHGIDCCPNRRGIQWTYALQAWFDKHLWGRNVSTGTPVEIFMADASQEDAAGGARTEVLTTTVWPGPSKPTTFFPTADSGLTSAGAGDAGLVAFTGGPDGFVSAQQTQGATFRTAPLTSDLVMVGQPTLKLAASVSTPRVHLIANLFDESPAGAWRRISQCAINPELRDGLAQRSVVVPGTRYDMTPSCFAIAHNLRAGHRLVLRVTTSDPDKIPMFAGDPRVTVFTGAGATSVDVPVIENPVLHPEGGPIPAQAPVTGSVTTLAPGVGERQPGVTSQFLEFDVPESVDNARSVTTATNTIPADIDLFLQRRQQDGSWGDDLTSGESPDTAGERMESERLDPGHYRVEVHNWAGPPANEIALKISFYNSGGRVGE